MSTPTPTPLPQYRIVTCKQFKGGWIERRGCTLIHHSFELVRRLDADTFIVREPTLPTLPEDERE